MFIANQHEMHKKDMMISQMCWNRSTCMNHMLYYFWVFWFERSRSSQLCFHTADLLMCTLAQLEMHLHSVCPTGARVCYRPWTRTTRWTWSTSQRGSSLSPSPAAWKSRAMQPTCGRLPPCCAPSTAKTTWYTFFPTSPVGIRCRNLPWLSSH